MSDDPFQLRTEDLVFEQVWDTVSKLPQVDWAAPMVAFAGVATLAWIGLLSWGAFELWAALKLLEASLN